MVRLATDVLDVRAYLLLGYDAITTALHASQEFRCLSVQFEIEKSRLVNFNRAAGFESHAGDDGVSPVLLQHKPLLLRVLSEIETALLELVRDTGSQRVPTSGYAQPTVPSDLSDGYDDLAQRVSAARPAVEKTFGLAGALLWTVSEKSRVEATLQRLGRFNDFLQELLDSRQELDFQARQRQQYFELVQLKDSVEDIRRLTEAAQAVRKAHRQSNPRQQLNDTELENLSAFKSLYLSQINGRYPSKQNEISESALDFEQHSINVDDFPCAIYTSRNKTTQVWMSVQDMTPHNDKSDVLEELVTLLQAPMPEEMCIPPCLGYHLLQKANGTRFHTLIFTNPSSYGPGTKPCSLSKALTSVRKPSLTDRVLLAQKISQCLQYIHVTNWLHKALRSDNVLFFLSIGSHLDVRDPYIIGFDNSRRSRFNEQTSEVSRKGRLEAYRHPDTQMVGPQRSFRKTYDIYSLGLLLIEVAFWKPLVTIMEIEATVEGKPRAAFDIRDRWLNSEPDLFRRLKGKAGDKYATVVKTCLTAGHAFGVGSSDNETSSTTGLSIQRQFEAEVVRVLAQIAT